MLLRALATLGETTSFELDILGHGPMLFAWQAQANAITSANPVRFLGRVDHSEAIAHMHTADLFCFTSLRDTSGTAILEAQAAGVPVICFDHQGAHDMVDSTSGIFIPVTAPSRAVENWAHAIRGLSLDPERLLTLSHGASAKAREFLWSANGDRVNALYHKLGRESADKRNTQRDAAEGSGSVRATV